MGLAGRLRCENEMLALVLVSFVAYDHVLFAGLGWAGLGSAVSHLFFVNR